MREEVIKSICGILDNLKDVMNKEGVSFAVGKDTNSLYFFDKETYLKENKYDGFKVAMKELDDESKIDEVG